MEPLSTQSYRLTENTIELDNGIRYDPKLLKLLRKSHDYAVNIKPGYLNWVTKIIEEHPHIPELRNHRMVYFLLSGNEDQAQQENQRILNDFPTYLYAKTFAAQMYIENGSPQKAISILGEELRLEAFAPTRKTFHYNEFATYYQNVILYLIATGEIVKANDYLAFLEAELPADYDLSSIRTKVQIHSMQQSLMGLIDKSKNQHENSLHPKHDATIQSEDPPELHHEELWVLYKNSLDIDPTILQELLTLPRETLIADLRAIAWDSARRFEYFQRLIEEEGSYTPEVLSFPLHAIVMLAQLRATEALPTLLDMLQQGEEYLQFWYGDEIFETWPQVLYHITHDRTDELKAFMQKENLHAYAKSVVLDVMNYIVLLEPERTGSVEQWFREVGDFYLAELDNPLVRDITSIGYFLMATLALPAATDFVPYAEKFHAANLYDDFLLGSLATYKEEAQKSKPNNDASPFQSLEAFYAPYQRSTSQTKNTAPLLSNFANDGPASARSLSNAPEQPVYSQPHTEPKVGRNAPCPCGSGKKYKRCCGRK